MNQVDGVALMSQRDFLPGLFRVLLCDYQVCGAKGPSPSVSYQAVQQALRALGPSGLRPQTWPNADVPPGITKDGGQEQKGEAEDE